MKADLLFVLTAYHALEEALRDSVRTEIPLGSIVSVFDCHYNGYGIHDSLADTPADRIAVRLENGNVWHYPIQNVRRSYEDEIPPNWIKREMRKRKKQKATK